MQRSLEEPGAGNSAWFGVFCGFSALFVGIGLCRFAYTPLIPAVIGAGWFSPADAAYLGAANLAGYFAGALGAKRFAASAGTARALRAMMLLAAVTFFASAFPLPFLWFGGWRFCSGLAGGALMVLAAPLVLPAIPEARRGLASGLIFSGVGLGIAVAGMLVPLLLTAGLSETWLALGALSGTMTIVVWKGWPDDTGPGRAVPSSAGAMPRSPLRLRALYLEYGLNAMGLVPHMIFLVDYVARGLGRGIAAGGTYWTLFGIGAAAGPLVAGALADRFGYGRTLRAAFLVQAAAVAAITASPGVAALVLSSLVTGAMVPGIVPLVLGRIGELLPGDPAAVRHAWSRATAAFALGQALAGYGYSFIFSATGGYEPLYLIATAALLTALAIDLAATALAASGFLSRRQEFRS